MSAAMNVFSSFCGKVVFKNPSIILRPNKGHYFNQWNTPSDFSQTVRHIFTSANRFSRWTSGGKGIFSRGGQTKKGGLVLEAPAGIPGGVSGISKPVLFTVAFSSTCFVGAAIWQYENVRREAVRTLQKPFLGKHHAKLGDWRDEVHQWWTSLTEGQRIFYPICFLNCIVFLAWRVPAFQPTMYRLFCCSPTSKAVCWPMLLSTFSHYSAFHLFANMYVLHSFSTAAVSLLGKEQFLGLYLSSGVVASLASYSHKLITGRHGLSLGASGAITAILGLVCTQVPDTRLAIIFIPGFTFTAGTALKAILAIDTAGVLLGWRFFDHAAHLGGTLFGIAWCLWGNHYIWQKREPIVRWWHNVRE